MSSVPTQRGSRLRRRSCSSRAPGFVCCREPSCRIMALVESAVRRAVPSAPPRSRAAHRLIINADDFGLSHDVNAAVIRAHTEGVLTTASLMVNEEGFEEAVDLARSHPRLGVGLHLSLVCGRSALTHSQI